MPPMHEPLLAPCASCHRHVRASEARCPFCAQPQPARPVRVVRVEAQSRAALLALSSAIAAACEARTTVERASASAALDASQPAATEDAAIDAAPSTDSADAGAAVVSWDGLGLTGWGAAYGASPLDPHTRDIGAPSDIMSFVDVIEPDAPQTRRALVARLPAMRRCFQRERGAHPRSGGSFVLRFERRPDGAVVDTRVDAPRFSAAFAGCVRPLFERSSLGATAVGESAVVRARIVMVKVR